MIETGCMSLGMPGGTDPQGDFLRFLVRLRAYSNLVKPLAREKDKHPPASGYSHPARPIPVIARKARKDSKRESVIAWKA
jgi:hypothetical protein